MSTYAVPVLPQSDSDPAVYYSWQERPECRVLLNQPCTPIPPPTEQPKNAQKNANGSCQNRQKNLSASSVDARSALDNIAKGTAKGDICALTFRLWLQTRLFKLGCVIESHRWTILVVGIIALGLCCLGLKTVRLETDVEKLWLEESSRIAKELKYTRDMLGEETSKSSYEMLLQTGQNLLHPLALLEHERMIQVARSIKVRVGTREWTYEKLCRKIPLGGTPGHHIPMKLIRQSTPCLIITPLDCFWDGAKVLGPDHPATLPGENSLLPWTVFNPEMVLKNLSKLVQVDSFQMTINMLLRDFREMGISVGYQNRTCLDPMELNCPRLAPNYGRKGPVDVGGVLRGGCPGFFANLMHWPEAMIVGGAEYNAERTRLRRIRALQSLLVMRSPQSLFEEVKLETHHYEWTLQKAQHVIRTWQKALRERIAQMDMKAAAAAKAPGASVYSTEHVYAFTESSLKDLMERVTRHIDPVTLGGGAFLVALYITVCFVRWKEPVRSHTWLALVGFLICALTVVAGLGFSAVVGLTFNILTVKVLPFLMLGIAMDDCLRLTSHFDQLASSGQAQQTSVIGETLKSAGPPLLIASISNIVAILVGAIIPVPVMQSFCLQAGLVLCFQLLTALLLLPALLSLDLQRRRGFRVDFLCCLATRPDNPLTLMGTPQPARPPRRFGRGARLLSPRGLLRRGLIPAFRIVPVKALVVALAAAAIGVSGYGALRFSYGLDFASVVARGSPEHDFVAAQHRLLGVYNFFVSTGPNFAYAKEQATLRRFYKALRQVEGVMTSSGKSQSSVFWLDCLRDWLTEVQADFDMDVARGNINVSTGVPRLPGTSRNGLIGMLLLIQTGRSDGKVDMHRLNKERGRLVSPSGIITEDAFYNYLTAWRYFQRAQYETVQDLLRPEPAEIHIDLPLPFRTFPFLKSVPAANNLEFTRMNFFFKDMKSSAAMLRAVKGIRSVTDNFSEMGLKTYPSGIPFVYFEQYFHLPKALSIAIGLCFGILVFLLLFSFFNVPIVLLGVGHLFITLAELCGVCSFLAFHLNGISAAVLLSCVGLCARCQAPLLWTFLTSRGNRQKRTERTLLRNGPPAIHAAAAMLLALAVLAVSPLDFIVINFFQIISLAVVLSIFNTLILLPAVLAMIGPASQFRPSPDWGSTSTSLHDGPGPRPPPDTDPGLDRDSLRRPSVCVRPRPASLSTISEEPSRVSSSSSLDADAVPSPARPSVVLVEPEIVVRTSTAEPRFARANNGQQVCCHDNPSNHVTTVKATAKFKVEVHSSPSPFTLPSSHLSSSSDSASGSSSDSFNVSHTRAPSEKNLIPDHKSTKRHHADGRFTQQHYPPQAHHQHKPKHHHRLRYHHHQSQRRQVYSSHLQSRNYSTEVDDESGIDTCEE